MRVDLHELGPFPDEATLTGPDGRTYRRRSTRMSRRTAGELVRGGTPLVLHLWSAGQLDWLDGDDALAAWDEERPHVTTQEPTAKQLAKHVAWHAGLWEADDDARLVLLTGSC
ncbi:MAG: hypothetical protein PGN07_07935 [Aeromicrobium erythreum]